MRPTPISAVLFWVACAWPCATHAQGPTLKVEAGYTHVLDRGHGGGLNLYGAYELSFGLDVELKVGFHAVTKTYGPVSERGDPFTGTIDIRAATILVPIMVGARYRPDFGVRIRPIVAAHFGATNSTMMIGEAQSFPDLTDNWTGLAFDVGAGVEYLLTDSIALGAVFWWCMVFGRTGWDVGPSFHSVNTDITLEVLTASLTFSARF